MKELAEVLSLDDRDDEWEEKISFLQARPSKKICNLYFDFEVIDDVVGSARGGGNDKKKGESGDLNELKDILKNMATMQTEMMSFVA